MLRGWMNHKGFQSKNVIFKQTTNAVNVCRAQTGLQNFELGIFQHSKATFPCWKIPNSQFRKPVWARQTLTGRNIIFTFLGSP